MAHGVLCKSFRADSRQPTAEKFTVSCLFISHNSIATVFTGGKEEAQGWKEKKCETLDETSKIERFFVDSSWVLSKDWEILPRRLSRINGW